MPLPKTLQKFLAQSAAWTLLCALCELVCRYWLHWGYPYDYPMVPSGLIFGDLRFFRSKFPFFHSHAFFAHGQPLPYPAPAAAIYKIFFPSSSPLAHGPLPTLAFLLVALILSVGMLTLLHRALVARRLAPGSATWLCIGVYIFSFPLWFAVHEGNIEIFVWLALCIALWAHWTSRSWIAALFIALATALKLYPIVFMGLLLARKQYRQLAVSLLCTAAITVAGLWLVCPDIPYSWHQTYLAIGTLSQEHLITLNPINSGFDHTLWVLFKQLLPRLPAPARLNHLLALYMVLAAVAGTALFFFRIVKLPLANQILCLTIAAILFPPVSFDYTLLQLYVPFALILFAALQQRDRPSRVLTISLALFAFVLSPQSEFILHGMRIAGSLKAVALSALFVLGAVFPIALKPRQRRSPLPPATEDQLPSRSHLPCPEPVTMDSR
jgi:hypothetical protein